MRDPKKKSKLHRADFARGFNIDVAALIVDGPSFDLILGDFSGPKASVKANVMQLRVRKTNHWISDYPIKMDKESAHITLQDDLPNGWTNWVIVSRQAIPSMLDPNRPTFFWADHSTPMGRWDRSLGAMPKTFYPIFAATVNFPTLPQWATPIWDSLYDMSHLVANIRGTKEVRAYKLRPNNDDWRELIERLFSTGKISIYDNQEPETEPETTSGTETETEIQELLPAEPETEVPF